MLRRRRIPSLPGGPTASARPPIIDAEGNPLVVQDGTYGGGGKPGDVWYGGTWVDPTVAERGIIDDRHALEERQHEITTFQAGTDIERGNWLHDVEVESQAGGTANTNAPQAPDVPAVTPAQMDDLGNRFTDSVNEMINAGYTVKNRNPIVAAGNTIRDIESWLVKHFGGEGIDDPRAGRCGEYGQWGIDRSKDFVKDVFGPGAVVDDIVIQQRSIPGSLGEAAGAVAGSAPPGVDQRLYLANHRATHVTLPDGSRYVLDYWDGVATGKPAIVTEQQWLEKWKPTMGGDFRIDRSPGATELRTYINQFGEQRGMDFYRSKTHDELTIRSWQKAPW